MKVKQLIERLERFDGDREIIFYHLSDNNLEQALVESCFSVHDGEGNSWVELSTTTENLEKYIDDTEKNELYQQQIGRDISCES